MTLYTRDKSNTDFKNKRNGGKMKVKRMERGEKESLRKLCKREAKTNYRFTGENPAYFDPSIG